MFAISPVASTSVTALRPLQVDAPERVASVIASVLPVPVALDPRTHYALSTQAADAVLALVQVKAPTQDTLTLLAQQVETPPVNDAETATSPELAGDPRPDVSANGEVASATPVPNGRTAAAGFESSIAETRTAQQAKQAADWEAYLYKITHVDSNVMNAISFYLMANDANYRDFKNEHPSVDVHWINVDNKKIVSLWPRITDKWFPETV
ncbi:hypothetical protein [Methylobacterium pseudosasicola]|uniref:Uncharacterized protein n=1 Tax=Methylobacterium pseudosasicola TaxID=582667 RepID=A0A1I4J116_9HYPH|nr:hypothetical protein [Methylobacterium pseudosasicola]SFL59903.1 hypothetical protein SAMN05192568_100760 [Methylobacterium pseudosasicola]